MSFQSVASPLSQSTTPSLSFQEQVRQPSFLQQLGAGVGQGLGQGFQSQISQAIQQKAIQKALSGLGPNATTVDYLRAAASLPPESREAITPILEAQMKQQQGQQFNQAINQILNPQGTLQQSTGAGAGTQVRGAQRAPQISGVPAGNYTPQQEGKLVDVGLAVRKEAAKATSEQIKREEARSAPILKKIDEERSVLPRKQAAINAMKRNAAGNIKDRLQNVFADYTGNELFRGAKAAQFITGGKELFFSSLGRAGGRPSVFLEQKVEQMLGDYNRTEEAKLSLGEMFQFDHDLQQKETEIYDQLSEQFVNDIGYVPGNIGKIADEIIKPYAKQREEKLAYDIQRIHEKENPKDLQRPIKVSHGTPLTIEKAQVLLKQTNGDKVQAEKLAKQMGYTIPSQQTYAESMQK